MQPGLYTAMRAMSHVRALAHNMLEAARRVPDVAPEALAIIAKLASVPKLRIDLRVYADVLGDGPPDPGVRLRTTTSLNAPISKVQVDLAPPEEMPAPNPVEETPATKRGRK